MSAECLLASKRLLDEKCHRGSVNRSYYAAYCAISGLLPPAMKFGNRSNPPHERVKELVTKTLKMPQFVGKSRRFQMAKRFNYLRMTRVDADYKPGVRIDRSEALQCLHIAIFICRTLGVE